MMVLLVTGNNYLLLFLGWEGVGVCSYLLINFWFTRIAANQSSISAFLTNRVGDCFFTVGIIAILWSFGNLLKMLIERLKWKKINKTTKIHQKKTLKVKNFNTKNTRNNKRQYSTAISHNLKTNIKGAYLAG